MYRVDGKQRRDTLGPYPKVSVAQARSLAGDALELLGQGKDPRVVSADSEAERKRIKADTVAAIGEEFISKYASKLRWSEVSRIMRRDVIPQWEARPIAEITRRDVINLVDAVAERAPIQANRVLTVLSIFFGWALDRDVVQADPTNRVRKPTKEKARERVLNDVELAAFWKSCDALDWPFGPLLKLLALTGQRKSEIGELRWSEVNIESKRIDLSATRYKSGKPHAIPLSAKALEIINGLNKVGEEPNFVFTTTGETPVSGFSRAKTNLDALMLEELKRNAASNERDKAKLEPWVIHDLRRTVRTNLSRLGVSAEISERVLGHAVPGLRGVYDRHDFLPEMRQALERWSKYLIALIST
jgi:integrase